MDEKCFCLTHTLSAKLAYFLFYKSESISISFFLMTEKSVRLSTFVKPVYTL